MKDPIKKKEKRDKGNSHEIFAHHKNTPNRNKNNNKMEVELKVDKCMMYKKKLLSFLSPFGREETESNDVRENSDLRAPLLKDTSRKGFITCDDLLKTVKDSLPPLNRSLLENDITEILIEDIRLDLHCPMNSTVLEVGLWRRIRRTLSAIEDFLYRMKKKESITIHDYPSQFDKGVESNQFRDLYVSVFTDSFADDLSKIRQQKDTFDGNKVNMMISCIEAGMNIYTDIEKNFVMESMKEWSPAEYSTKKNNTNALDKNENQEKEDTEKIIKDEHSLKVKEKHKQKKKKKKSKGKRKKDELDGIPIFTPDNQTEENISVLDKIQNENSVSTPMSSKIKERKTSKKKKKKKKKQGIYLKRIFFF